MGLNVHGLAAAVYNNIANQEAVPYVFSIVEPNVPSTNWCRFATVLQGGETSLSLLFRSATLNTVAAFMGAATADMLLNPDKYVDQFSDLESAPVEQSNVEPEIIEQPYEPVNLDEPIPIELQSGKSTQELLELGYDPMTALYFGDELNICKALMLRQLPDTTEEQMARHLVIGEKFAVRHIPDGISPLQHAFDQFIGNAFSIFQLMEISDEVDEMFEIQPEGQMAPNLYCGAAYLHVMNQNGLVTEQMIKKLSRTRANLEKFLDNVQFKISDSTRASLEELINIIDRILL